MENDLKTPFRYYTDLTICGTYIERRDFEYSRIAGGGSMANMKREYNKELRIFKNEIFPCQQALDFSTKVAFARWDNVARARRQIFLLVNGNYSERALFIRLSFAPEFYDDSPVMAWRHFRVFIRNYSVYLFGKKNKIKCVAVCERGEKTKRLHFHLVFLNPPEKIFDHDLFLAKNKQNEFSSVAQVWKFGQVDVRDAGRTKDGEKSVDDLGAYIAKYLVPDARPKGAVSYFSSRNLARPEKIYTQEKVLARLNTLDYNIVRTESHNYNNGSVQKIICKKKQLVK